MHSLKTKNKKMCPSASLLLPVPPPPSLPVTIKRAINPLCCAIETASGLGAGPVTGCHDLWKTFPVEAKKKNRKKE